MYRSYLHNATDFCNHLRRFLAKDAFYLLSSKVTSDVLEIIDFLVTVKKKVCFVFLLIYYFLLLVVNI